MSDIKNLIETEARAAEEADPNTPIPEGTKVTRGHDRTKTLQVRLNEEEYDYLAAAAAERELPVSTLVRSMLLGSLRPTVTTVEERVERLERQLNEMSALVESLRRAPKRAHRHARKATASGKSKATS